MLAISVESKMEDGMGAKCIASDLAVENGGGSGGILGLKHTMVMFTSYLFTDSVYVGFSTEVCVCYELLNEKASVLKLNPRGLYYIIYIRNKY